MNKYLTLEETLKYTAFIEWADEFLNSEMKPEIKTIRKEFTLAMVTKMIGPNNTQMKEQIKYSHSYLQLLKSFRTLTKRIKSLIYEELKEHSLPRKEMLKDLLTKFDEIEEMLFPEHIINPLKTNVLEREEETIEEETEKLREKTNATTRLNKEIKSLKSA